MNKCHSPPFLGIPKQNATKEKTALNSARILGAMIGFSPKALYDIRCS